MARRRDQALVRNRPLDLLELIDLTIGPGRRGSAFPSDRHRKAAWQAHRDRVIERMPHGRMPHAFWSYEGPAELRDRPSDCPDRARWLRDHAVRGT